MPVLVRLLQMARLALVAGTLVAPGCSEAEAPQGDLVDWQASDHAQPRAPDSSRQAAPAAGEAPEPTAAQIEQAAAGLFLQRCASCHGAQGRGDGPQAPTQDMPDLTAAAYQEDRSDADIARAIRMGNGLMPAFGSELNERGIAALVGHVRRLRAAE